MNKRERAKEGEATEEQQEQHRDQEQEVRFARNQNSYARDLACKQQRLQARELQHSLYQFFGFCARIVEANA